MHRNSRLKKASEDWCGTVVPTPVLVWSRLRKLAPQKVRSAPQAATTVLFIPDDWRDGCQKHAE